MKTGMKCGEGALIQLTHCVPNVDVALSPPVVALREGLPVREHVAFFHVWTFSKAVVVQPGSPVVHVTRSDLSVGCPGEKKNQKQSEIRDAEGFVDTSFAFLSSNRILWGFIFIYVCHRGLFL